MKCNTRCIGCKGGEATHAVNVIGMWRRERQGNFKYLSVACDDCVKLLVEYNVSSSSPYYALEFYDPEKHNEETVCRMSQP
jgi:hypothetical protein